MVIISEEQHSIQPEDCMPLPRNMVDPYRSILKESVVSPSQEEILKSIPGWDDATLNDILTPSQPKHGSSEQQDLPKEGYSDDSESEDQSSGGEPCRTFGVQEPVEWASPDTEEEKIDDSYNPAFESDRSQSPTNPGSWSVPNAAFRDLFSAQLITQSGIGIGASQQGFESHEPAASEETSPCIGVDGEIERRIGRGEVASTGNREPEAKDPGNESQRPCIIKAQSSPGRNKEQKSTLQHGLASDTLVTANVNVSLSTVDGQKQPCSVFAMKDSAMQNSDTVISMLHPCPKQRSPRLSSSPSESTKRSQGNLGKMEVDRATSCNKHKSEGKCQLGPLSSMQKSSTLEQVNRKQEQSEPTFKATGVEEVSLVTKRRKEKQPQHTIHFPQIAPEDCMKDMALPSRLTEQFTAPAERPIEKEVLVSSKRRIAISNLGRAETSMKRKTEGEGKFGPLSFIQKSRALRQDSREQEQSEPTCKAMGVEEGIQNVKHPQDTIHVQKIATKDNKKDSALYPRPTKQAAAPAEQSKEKEVLVTSKHAPTTDRKVAASAVSNPDRIETCTGHIDFPIKNKQLHPNSRDLRAFPESVMDVVMFHSGSLPPCRPSDPNFLSVVMNSGVSLPLPFGHWNHRYH